MAYLSLISDLAQSGAGEWFMILSLVFGGCCSNVWALEGVLKHHPRSGTFLTFAQFVYVAITNLSSQLDWRRTKSGISIPRLKERKVPLSRWAVQVVLFLAISLMNNYAFGLKIPVTIHIIFRSGGLCVSMLVGRVAGKRRYSAGQVLAALLITIGIIVATISVPRRSTRPSSPTPTNVKINQASSSSSSSSWLPAELEYFAGIVLLSLALFISAFLGLWQEKTYKVYGRQWKEALFYGHALSLPYFIPLRSSLIDTYDSFVATPPVTLLTLPFPSNPGSLISANYLRPISTQPHKTGLSGLSSAWELGMGWYDLIVPSAILSLILNIITQGICVRGVNRLTTKVNAVTVNLILTVRKAVSLAISVWYYGSGVNAGLIVGGGMVMVGTILYSLAPGPQALEDPSPDVDNAQTDSLTSLKEDTAEGLDGESRSESESQGEKAHHANVIGSASGAQAATAHSADLERSSGGLRERHPSKRS